MFFKSRRFAYVVALCSALANIEYSNVARADEVLGTAPMATPTPTPMVTPVPLREPVIDAQAQSLLRQMATAYAKLDAFSCVVDANGVDGKEILKFRASIAWQKPNRFSFMLMKDGGVKRIVSNGQFMFERDSRKPGQYIRTAMPRRADLTTALQMGGAADLLISEIDTGVAHVTSLAFQKEDQVILRFGSEIENRPWSGADVVAVEGLPEGEPARAQFVIDRKSHLLRQIKLSGIHGGVAGSLSETYSNVRLNPALPASTFAFEVRPGEKLRTATKSK